MYLLFSLIKTDFSVYFPSICHVSDSAKLSKSKNKGLKCLSQINFPKLNFESCSFTLLYKGKVTQVLKTVYIVNVKLKKLNFR